MDGDAGMIHLPARLSVLQLVDGTTVDAGVGRPARDTPRASGTDPLANAVPLMDLTVPVGQGPPMHRHPGMAEAFCVLAGEVDLSASGTVRRIRLGDVVVVPAGVAHAYRSVGTEPARLLFLHLSK